MQLETEAYGMPTGMLLHEAGKQFAMAEIIRDGWQRVLYERGGWFQRASTMNGPGEALVK